MRILAAIGVLAMTSCASAPAGAPEAQVEALMWDYTRAWNRHDAAAVARDFYRMRPSVEEQTASLERMFEGLRAQGYHHSDIHEIKACLTGPDTAWAGMKFSRLKETGEPLPPKDRASSYELRKFDDGWRITRVGGSGVSADQPLICPSN